MALKTFVQLALLGLVSSFNVPAAGLVQQRAAARSRAAVHAINMVKVAIVSTSASEWKGGPTGVWLEEMASPYYAFKGAGFETQLASVKGGAPPVDPNSRWEDFYTSDAKRFDEDAEAQAAFKSTAAVSTLNAADLDAIFLPGGHGPLVDCIENPDLIKLVDEMYAQGKVVSAVCHGPIGLVNCKKPDGTPLLQGQEATIFSDAEETQIDQHDNAKDELGWLCESKFRELGGKYSSGDPWTSHVVTCGNLITGQNPQSSPATAQAVVNALK